MANEIYSLEGAGIACWDVFTKTGRFAGLIVTRKDGTLRHYYDTNASKGSAKKFLTISDALENIGKRREAIKAKRAAA